jgi:hypothetical protein
MKIKVEHWWSEKDGQFIDISAEELLDQLTDKEWKELRQRKDCAEAIAEGKRLAKEPMLKDKIEEINQEWFPYKHIGGER